MSIHQAEVIGCFIALLLTIIGAIMAESNIIKKTKEIMPLNDSIVDITFLGICLIDILPLCALILTIIVILQ